MTTMKETMSVSREPGYWRHKTRAVLLPTPLAELDAAGEQEREASLLAWLGLEQERAELHGNAARDARGVHVPESVRTLRWEARSGEPSADIPMRSLVHPLSGERPRDAEDAIWKLDEQRRRYSAWIGALQRDRDPPSDSHSFANLWHDLCASVGRADAKWVGRVPGALELRDHTWLAQRTMASALVGARFDGGEACLLYVHCGPVQSFIAAARRTSDLWLGSYLISLLAYEATKTIADLCGPDSVIYPHLATLPLAQRDRHSLADRAGRPMKEKQAWLRASQPNRFVAVVDESKAQAIATLAARAVCDRWARIGEAVRKEISDEHGLAGFDEQLSALLDIDVVLQPWPDDKDVLHAMLAAAKRVSQHPPEHARTGAGEYYEAVFGLGRDTLGAQRRVLSFSMVRGDARVKCTQCGRREAMGPRHDGCRRSEWRDWWETLRSQLNGSDPSRETVQFRNGEWLCAVCLTKRLACCYDLAGSCSELGLAWSKEKDRALLRFPSVASIAAAPLRLYLREQVAHQEVRRWTRCLQEVHKELEFEFPGNLLPGLGEIGRGMDVLDCDGTWLYARSYERETVLNDHDSTGVDSEKFDRALEEAREAFGRIGKLLGSSGRSKPSSMRATPYYAVVVLDVDEMGRWLDGSHQDRPSIAEVLAQSGLSIDQDHSVEGMTRPRPVSSSLHAEVSRRQGELATKTLHEIVEHAHLGRLVYSGGDDVLAFVPLHTLWGCLRDIERAFTADSALGSKITLSAGVAIRDWRSPLSLALRAARRAEGKAKLSKNCVVVDLEIRSGAPLDVQLPWWFEEDGQRRDLADVSTMVEALVRAEVQGESPMLLRPSAVEVLRRELDTLRDEGLEEAFKARVAKLVRPDGKARPWIEHMVEVLHPERKEKVPKYVRILARKHRDLGQSVNFLLLLRFLAREHGGMEHEDVYKRIAIRQEQRKKKEVRP